MKNENSNEIIHQPSRLQWMCRRGMLELDVLLGKFLETGYASLSDDEKRQFVELLNCPDPDLFAWLLGTDEPEQLELRSIIGKIKRHVRSGI